MRLHADRTDLPFIERADVYALWASSAVGAAPQINTFLCPSTPPDAAGTPRLAYVANVGTCGVAGPPFGAANKYDGVLLDTVPRWNGSQFISDTLALDDLSTGDGTASTLLFSERSGPTLPLGTWDVCPTTAIQFVYTAPSTAYAAASLTPVPAMGVAGSGITPVINNPLATAPADSLPTVTHVDLGRYAGTWHEIARLPNWFQRSCERSQARYTPCGDGLLEVVNTCFKANGRSSSLEGIATPVAGSGNGLTDTCTPVYSPLRAYTISEVLRWPRFPKSETVFSKASPSRRLTCSRMSSSSRTTSLSPRPN